MSPILTHRPFPMLLRTWSPTPNLGHPKQVVWFQNWNHPQGPVTTASHKCSLPVVAIKSRWQCLTSIFYLNLLHIISVKDSNHLRTTKMGSPSGPSNHCPSSTPAASRVAKRLVKQHMMGFPLSENLIHVGQPGFPKYRWPTTCRYEVFNSVTLVAHARSSPTGNNLDMTQAFHHLSSPRLLLKVVNRDISETFFFFKSHFFNCHQAVPVDDKVAHPIL